MFGVQEGLELPEDEEEKKKTEADKEKFGGLCKVFFQTTCRIFFSKQSWNWNVFLALMEQSMTTDQLCSR